MFYDWVQPDVVELRQQMTPAMTAIQMAVLDIMKALVAELKAAHPAVSMMYLFSFADKGSSSYMSFKVTGSIKWVGPQGRVTRS